MARFLINVKSRNNKYDCCIVKKSACLSAQTRLRSWRRSTFQIRRSMIMNNLKSMKVLCAVVLSMALPVCATRYSWEASKGVVAGAVATVAVDNIKIAALHYMKKKNIDDWNLYKRFGLCRDRLTGDVTTSVAVLGVSVFDEFKGNKSSVGLGGLAARLVGVAAGSTAAKYATK